MPARLDARRLRRHRGAGLADLLADLAARRASAPVHVTGVRPEAARSAAAAVPDSGNPVGGMSDNYQRPAGHSFVPLAAVEKHERANRGSRRVDAQPLQNATAPFNERTDGLIDPLTWEGQSIPGRRWIVDDLIPCG